MTRTGTRTAPNGLSINMIMCDFGGLSFFLSETPLNGVTPPSLDEAVDLDVEGLRADWPRKSAAPVTATEIPRTTGYFEGVETRRFVYDLIDGNTKDTISALLFYRNDVFVQAWVAVSNGEGDWASVDRFLSSLKSRND